MNKPLALLFALAFSGASTEAAAFLKQHVR